MSKPKRQIVTKTYGVSLYDGVSLHTILAETANYPEVTDWSVDVDYGYSYNDPDTYRLLGSYKREETDQEYTQRVNKERKDREARKQNKALKEAKEKAEYERLKAKFKDA